MSDLTTATLRTVTPAAWAALIVWAASKFFGLTITVEELLPYLPIFVAVLGVFYRVGREIERKWPVLGRILFGSNKTPVYEPPAS